MIILSDKTKQHMKHLARKRHNFRIEKRQDFWDDHSTPKITIELKDGKYVKMMETQTNHTEK